MSHKYLLLLIAMFFFYPPSAYTLATDCCDETPHLS